MKSTGYLRYGKKSYWAILDCDDEIGRYYRDLYRLARYNVEWLQEPLDGSHITVVAGKYETPPNVKLWDVYEGESIEFTYDNNECLTDGIHYWFEIVSPRLMDIRLELGLQPNLKYPFHLSIGNKKHGYAKD